MIDEPAPVKLERTPGDHARLPGPALGEHTESIRAEFRAEGFNVFNRHRFGTGSVSLQDAQFGHLTSSGDLLNTPRQLQLALKVYF